MSWTASRAQRRQLERDNAKQPAALVEVPRSDWPLQIPPGLMRAWRSRDFLVQLYRSPEPAIWRLSVNRTSISGERWRDGISWDELQRLKAEAGFSHTWAVEVYPSAESVVNVGNLRHLWLLPEPPPYAWGARDASPSASTTQP